MEIPLKPIACYSRYDFYRIVSLRVLENQTLHLTTASTRREHVNVFMLCIAFQSIPPYLTPPLVCPSSSCTTLAMTDDVPVPLLRIPQLTLVDRRRRKQKGRCFSSTMNSHAKYNQLTIIRHHRDQKNFAGLPKVADKHTNRESRAIALRKSVPMVLMADGESGG